MVRLLRIAQRGLRLGATIFGRVAVAYPVIRERALKLGKIRPEEVDGLYARAVFRPGPSFIHLWGAMGARVAGVPGAVVAVVSPILPAGLIALPMLAAARLPVVAAHGAGRPRTDRRGDRCGGRPAGAERRGAGGAPAGGGPDGVVGFHRVFAPLFGGCSAQPYPVS